MGIGKLVCGPIFRRLVVNDDSGCRNYFVHKLSL